MFLSLSAQAKTDTIPILGSEAPKDAWTVREQVPDHRILQLGPAYTEAEFYDWRLLENNEKPRQNCIEWSPIIVEVPRCRPNKKNAPAKYDQGYPMGRWEACLKGKREKPVHRRRFDMRIVLDCEQLMGKGEAR